MMQQRRIELAEIHLPKVTFGFRYNTVHYLRMTYHGQLKISPKLKWALPRVVRLSLIDDPGYVVNNALSVEPKLEKM